MLKNQILKVLLCLVFFYVSKSASQNYNVEVSKIEGIEDNITYKVDQDKDGFIWFASRDYINKYDGKHIESYSLEELELDNFLRIDIIPDVNNNIWYYDVFDFQIKILDTKTGNVNSFKDVFKRLPFLEKNIVNALYRDKDYNIYITVKGKGLYKYDGKQISLVQKVLDSADNYISYYATDLFTYIAYGKKIIRVNNESLQKQVFISPNMVKVISTFKGKVIFITKKVNYNFIIYHIEDDELIDYLPNVNLHNFYTISFIPHQNYNTDNYCINLKDELIFINDKKEVLFSIDKSKYFNVNAYNGFYRDRNNNLWISTNEGLFKATIKKNTIKTYLEGYSLRSIVKRDSTLYVGTYKGGLASVTPEGKSSSHQLFNKVRNAGGLLLENETLWMSVTSRVYRYDFINKKADRIKDNNKTENRRYLSFGYHPVTNTVFLGSYFRLSKIDKAKNEIIPLNYFNEFIPKGTKVDVRCFKEEGNNLWIGTSIGLFLMDKNEKIVKWIGEKEGLPTALIQHIYIEDKNTLWLATNGKGLIKWDRVNNKFTSYTEEEGLSNSNVYAIYKDEFGFFWLPTDNGLNRFAPNTLKNKILLPNDGITNKEFNYMSHFQDDNGLLYFGGISGLNVINPKDFVNKNTTKAQEYKIIINSLNVLNEESHIIDNKEALLVDNKITLSTNTGYLELKFSIMDFLDEPPLQSLYKIEPLHSDYMDAENNAITLSGLKSGEYQLYIKVQSHNGQWTTLKKTINVEFDSLLYNIGFFIIVFIVVLYSIINISKRKLKTQQPKTDINIEENHTKSKKDIEVNAETPLIEETITKEDQIDEKYISWLKEFDTLILNNIASITFSLEFLSQELDISERQLHRRIKKLTGKTPNKYITEIKLQEAYRLIEEGKVKSVKELSKRVGYSTTDYFSKLFKYRYNKNPSDLMKF